MANLILLPGMACDEEAWREIAPRLGVRHRVGVRTPHFERDSLAAMAAALLDGDAGPFVLIGHSMGGMVALEAAWQARRQPGRLAGVALLGSTARPDTPELIELRTRACAMYADGRMDEVLRANVPFAFDPANARDGALVERYITMIRRAGAQALIRQNRVVMARPDARPRLAGIEVPVLVATGAADLLTPPEQAREMAAGLPRARLEILEGCGHMLTLEAPDRVATLLIDWLDSLERSPGDRSPVLHEHND
jgi:pimeloyl-ACP methyl ester carboxylesterase